MAIIKVKTGGITADAITSTEIADNAVVTAAINADAVTDAKIADDVVGTEHLTANEVDTAALKADAVTGAELADNAVNSEHYTDGSIDTAHIADAQITAAKLASGVGGITVADQWRLTTSFTGVANPIASNLERVDTSGQGTIGSAMTESSGIFTFPSTGIYFVRYDWDGYINGDSRYIITYIQGTVNNSAYNNYSQKATFIQQTQSDNTSASVSLVTLVDVTNTTNCKIRFKVSPNNTSVTTNGTSAENRTCMTFIRLGDT